MHKPRTSKMNLFIFLHPPMTQLTPSESHNMNSTATAFTQEELLAKINQFEQQFAAKNFSDALISGQELVGRLPNNPQVHFYLALVFNNLNLFDQAYAQQLEAIRLKPDESVYHYNAATYADIVGNTLRAMLHYQRCLQIDPNNADALWNYSEHLRLDGHIQMAIECLHKLMALGQDHYDKFYNRLIACYALLEQYSTQTAELYQKLLQNPEDHIARWGFALDELKHERFESGFAFYNRRFESSALNNAYCYDFPYPRWDGVFHKGQTLLIHGEQGLGDEMMFLSTMNELLAEAKHTGTHIVIACKPALVRLFALSFPSTTVFAHKYETPTVEVAQLPISAQLPMGHLLQRYRKNMADFDANRKPFLVADAARAAYYNERIKIQGREAKDGQRRFRVGLMWGTVSAEAVQRFVRFANKKSIALPLFSEFEDVIDDVEFISLQNHERGAEAALLPELQIVDFSLDQTDFYDTAALMCNLDLIITIDTSIAHLAGGLGLETWVPLPKLADWRYGKERDTSYWYEGTQLFRQTKADHWHDVLDRMHTQLKARIQKNKEEEK